MNSPIANLAAEILLKIFEYIAQDPNASIVDAILCCKKWHPLAQSVLYGDVYLSSNRLFKFLDHSADEQIRSLSLRMEAIPVNRDDPYEAIRTTTAIETVKARLEALERLGLRIKKMKLISLSITVDFPLPFSASHKISSILDNLPDSCTSLEIDMTYSSRINCPEEIWRQWSTTHICDSIRASLPRLAYLRLRLPHICSSLFGVLMARGSHEHYEAVSAPKLKVCIINLNLSVPGIWRNLTAMCNCDAIELESRFFGPPVLPFLIPELQRFADINSSHLQRFWAIDGDSKTVSSAFLVREHSWAAWIRRDLMTDASFPMPVAKIGGFIADAWMARVPRDQGGVEDWLSSPARLEAVAEGHSWSETATGVRLATPMLRGYELVPRALAKSKSDKSHLLVCTLWQDEEATGERLLVEGPGPLMKEWDLNQRVPSGWKRDHNLGLLRRQT